MPKYCQEYNNFNTHNDTIHDFDNALNDSLDKIINNDIDVAFVYYPKIDNLGHAYGPDSEEIRSEIKFIDEIFDEFLAKVEMENMTEIINFIVVSDHGMTKNSYFVSMRWQTCPK